MSARYVSTRGGTSLSAGEAILAGLAPDGGLFVPEAFPVFAERELAALVTASHAEVATTLLASFVTGDPLAAELSGICAEAFDFPLPLVSHRRDGQTLRVLELFHGPTAAFKDVGARFLAGCFARRPDNDADLTILVATSGDTGGAVAAAFHRRPGLNVDIFYPEGLVSKRQEQQLTCWGDNVRSFRVAGNFDSCQALVKQALSDPRLLKNNQFSSANSINLGRLLPQMTYYAWASLRVRAESGRAASFIIPTGNLGNALACIWARRAGLPIERIVLATNANRSIPDYLHSGEWSPRSSIATLANAMDVGNPSNMERLRHLWPDVGQVRDGITAVAVSDAHIRDTIVAEFKQHQHVVCPHTATALHVYANLTTQERTAHEWVSVATAHAAKFDDIVEPLLGEAIPVPANLRALLTLPSQAIGLRPTLDALREYYR